MDHFISFLELIVEVAFWAFFGVLLLVASMRLFNWLTPGDLNHEVFVERNPAAAIAYGSVFVAIAILIAAAMH